MLSHAEIARYQRHLSLPGFGPEKQERLKEATVLVIGAGGLGCPALLYLAAAGVGRIVVIDSDSVEVSNLQRQVLFTEADVGRPKAEAAVGRLRALNPLIDYEAKVERFTRANAMELVQGCDIVVDGSDNFATRYLVNDACVLANKPFVYGAVQAFEGQVSVFNLEGGPTYRCLFPEPPAPGTVPTCAEGGVLGVMPGLIGTAQATEAIKVLAGFGEPLSGRLLLWDALSMTSQVVNLAVDARSREISELPPDGYGEVCEMDSPHTPHWEEGIPPEVDVDWLRERLGAGQPAVQMLDVREGWERELGSIEPSEHIPLGALEFGEADAAVEQLDRNAPLIIYCAAGVRSLRAADILKNRYGFKQPTSLRGGYKLWVKKPSTVKELQTSTVLTIAGSDSGAGAGIQADLRTIEALGAHAATAITAITAQNLHGVRAMSPVTPALLTAQIEAVLSDFAVGAIKTGLLPSAAAIRAVARAHQLKGKRIALIVDPVLASTTGTRFLSKSAVKVLQKELFPLATLVTPNWPEAAELTGMPVTSPAEASLAAESMIESGCAAVLIKGGHAPGQTVRDILMTATGIMRIYEGKRVATKNTHGTGCTLSAAIAVFLAQGEDLPTAVGSARHYLVSVLDRNRDLRWGAPGPVGR